MKKRILLLLAAVAMALTMVVTPAAAIESELKEEEEKCTVDALKNLLTAKDESEVEKEELKLREEGYDPFGGME